MKDVRSRMKSLMPSATWLTWEPVHRDSETFGCQLAFGSLLRPVYSLEKAQIILSLDGDPLQGHPDRLRHSLGFGKGRRPEDGPMNRLYAVESNFSLTGANADHRLPLRSGQVGPFLAALEAELIQHHGLQVPGGDEDANRAPHGGFLSEDKPSHFLKALASDLSSNQGKSVITVGASQPKEVHARAQRLNVALGNSDKTVRYIPAAQSNNTGDIRGLVDLLNRGAVKQLVILGGNPVYNAPADLNFSEALSKAESSIHLSLYRDETSLACNWHLPRAHWLESWGDARTWDGVISLRQPLMEPIWGGKSDLELAEYVSLGKWRKGEELVRQSNADRGDWRQMVHDGFVPSSSWPAIKVSPKKLPAISFSDSQLSIHPGKMEVNFVADGSVYDGRFANSGWLQELPDPMTKIVWDNAALMSAATADELGVSHESMVRIEVEGRSLELPVYVMPGHAAGSVTLPLGYGRVAAGQIAGIAGIADDMAEQNVDSVGFDTYKLRSSLAQYHIPAATVSATGATYSLVSTQDHHIIDEIGALGREDRLGDLIREGDLSEYESHPDFAQHRVHHPPLNSMWEERKYENVHKWGLSIDLAACTGCAGCTIACQSENNIAVVGKKQVSMGRELHWIRMDRYFSGPIEDPQVSSQPVSCHHCEMAPCEQVCPVAATTHTSEGLNDMIYNRCVGTRYCANNCPYKVRRFNYHLYSEAFQEEGNEVLKMVNNPEVTVRSRGVMEKCTYCVQRIQIARIEADNEDREIRDGEIAPACVQVCPTQAIAFGDLNQKGSAVSKAFENPRTYELLGELNLDTRTRYMAPIRNPHPSLAVKSSEHTTGATHGEHQEEVSHG